MKPCPMCHTMPIVCDFCRHHRFNGEASGGRYSLIYVGKGFCEFHKRKQDPEDSGCDDFYCFMLEANG